MNEFNPPNSYIFELFGDDELKLVFTKYKVSKDNELVLFVDGVNLAFSRLLMDYVKNTIENWVLVAYKIKDYDIRLWYTQFPFVIAETGCTVHKSNTEFYVILRNRVTIATKSKKDKKIKR